MTQSQLVNLKQSAARDIFAGADFDIANVSVQVDRNPSVCEI